MKTKEIVVTESGKDLTNKDDGFIIYGSLFKGDNQGGLIGDIFTIENIISSGVSPRAYTNTEFLEILDLNLDVLQKFIDERQIHSRS